MEMEKTEQEKDEPEEDEPEKQELVVVSIEIQAQKKNQFLYRSEKEILGCSIIIFYIFD